VSFTSAALRPVKSRRTVSRRPPYALEDRIEEVPKVPVRSRPHGVVSADHVGLVVNADRQDGAPEDRA
jgi:hypothetical protein